MTRTIELDHEKLAAEELVAFAEGGDEVVFTRGGDEVARLVPSGSPKRKKQSLLGSHPGLVTYIADDFDAELPDSFWFGEE